MSRLLGGGLDDRLMDRRRFLLTSLAGALAAPSPVRAHAAGKVVRIGFLSLAPAENTTR